MDQSVKVSDLSAAVRHMLPVIFLSTVLAAILSMALAWIIPPKYEVTALVAPPSDNFSEVLPSGSGLSGSLSSILGGSASSVSEFDKFDEVVNSPALAQRLISDHPEVITTIFRNQWDPETKSWHPPHTLGSLVKQTIRTMFHRPAWAAPNANDLSAYIKGSVTIANVGRSGMKSVTFSYPDPAFALRFVTLLRQEADALLRENAYQTTTTKIAYLLNQLQTASVRELHDALTQLLLREERRVMLMRNSLPFSAEFVAPPVKPTTPAGMTPFVVLTVSIFSGLIISTFISLWAYNNFDAVKRYDFRRWLFISRRPLRRASNQI